MSERMIELQRAKLGLPAMVQPGSTAPAPSSAAVAVARPSSVPIVQPTPQQLAASALLTEDGQLKNFLQRLQTRDESNPKTTSGPTVPTALSRRLLQKQGVGYLDETVAAITSAAADQFLATVLQQAIACRDRRLKGAEQMRDEARQRRKHRMEYKEDADERKRRKLAQADSRTKANLAAVAAAKDLNAGSKASEAAAAAAAAEADVNKAKKTKKKKSETENGAKKKEEDDESSEDSLDEEEEYYESFYNGEDEEVYEDDEDEELDTILLLRDLERPLEAWDFKLTGKLGLGLVPIEKEEAERLEEQEIVDTTEQEEIGGLPSENGQGTGDMPASPAANKTPSASPNAKGGEMKSPPGTAQKSAAAGRAATPAPVASPTLKSAPS
jgi:hypothetical protein